MNGYPFALSTSFCFGVLDIIPIFLFFAMILDVFLDIYKRKNFPYTPGTAL